MKVTKLPKCYILVWVWLLFLGHTFCKEGLTTLSRQLPPNNVAALVEQHLATLPTQRTEVAQKMDTGSTPQVSSYPKPACCGRVLDLFLDLCCIRIIKYGPESARFVAKLRRPPSGLQQKPEVSLSLNSPWIVLVQLEMHGHKGIDFLLYPGKVLKQGNWSQKRVEPCPTL